MGSSRRRPCSTAALLDQISGEFLMHVCGLPDFFLARFGVQRLQQVIFVSTKTPVPG